MPPKRKVKAEEHDELSEEEEEFTYIPGLLDPPEAGLIALIDLYSQWWSLFPAGSPCSLSPSYD